MTTSDRAPRAKTVLEEVAAATGLAPLIATGAVRRACSRAQIDPAHLTRADLRTILPHLEATLTAYFPPDQVAVRVATLRALAARA